jgi:hypothetical protein
MHRAVIGFVFLAAGLVSGCGGSTSAPSKIAAAPHGGNVVELPESKGFVELKTERDSKGARGSQAKSTIVAYFLMPDTTSPMSPAPTDVKLTIGPAGTGTVVSLAPQPKEPGLFASEIGSYPDALRGQIDFQLDGKPVTATFTFR